MEKQFTSADILAAKEVYLYCNNTLFIVDHDDEAYGFGENGIEWYHKENFWDYLEAFLENYFSFLKIIFENSFYYLFLVIFMIFSNIFSIFHKTIENI